MDKWQEVFKVHHGGKEEWQTPWQVRPCHEDEGWRESWQVRHGMARGLASPPKPWPRIGMTSSKSAPAWQRKWQDICEVRPRKKGR